jgi:hypothetical protein
MIKQSNPVLFVMMGTAAESAPELTRLLDGYRIKAAACVIVPDTKDVSYLRTEINRIQQEFLAFPYATVGLARVGYILHDAEDLIPLRQQVENILSPLYPSGLITDIYWLTDETSTLENDSKNRNNTLNVLAGGLPEAQIYLLSNLNSKSRHTPWTDILQTITLLTLFKDGEPKEYAVPPDASRYNELLFLQNTNRGKPFLTAGSQRLQVPQKALRAFLINALLQPLPIPSLSAPLLPLPKTTPWKPDGEFIYGIALPPEANHIIHDKMTRRLIINRLFGTRLSTLADMYAPITDDLTKLDFERLLDGFGLYDALEITNEKGHWPNFVNNAVRANAATLSAAEKSLQQWLDEPQDLKTLKTDKLRVSYLHQPVNYPYTLATEYLNRFANLRAYEKQGEQLSQMLTYIKEIHTRLEERQTAVTNARAIYEQDAETLTLTDTPLADTHEYFTNLFAGYARSNAETLRTLTRHYRKTVDLPALEEYTDAHILSDPVFARSFTEMLTYVADDKSITEWAIAAQHTHIRLRSGSTALYSEANLHMPTDWAAQVKRGYEAQGLGRANLFTDSTANRVSILFHAGAFGPDDLYYADLYRDNV